MIPEPDQRWNKETRAPTKLYIQASASRQSGVVLTSNTREITQGVSRILPSDFQTTQQHRAKVQIGWVSSVQLYVQLQQDNLWTKRRGLCFTQASLRLLQQNDIANGRLPARSPSYLPAWRYSRRAAPGWRPGFTKRGSRQFAEQKVLSHFGAHRAGSYFLEEWHNAPLLGSSLRRFLVACCCFAWSFAFVSVCCWLWFAWESRPDIKLEIKRNISTLTSYNLKHGNNKAAKTKMKALAQVIS